MEISEPGNIGIGLSNPLQKLHIQGATPTTLKIQNQHTNSVNQVSGISVNQGLGIEFGISALHLLTVAKFYPQLNSTSAGDRASPWHGPHKVN